MFEFETPAEPLTETLAQGGKEVCGSTEDEVLGWLPGATADEVYVQYETEGGETYWKTEVVSE